MEPYLINLRIAAVVLFCLWFLLWAVSAAEAESVIYAIQKDDLWFYCLGGALASTGVPWFKDNPTLGILSGIVTSFFAGFSMTPTVAGWMHLNYASQTAGLPLANSIAFCISVIAVPLIQTIYKSIPIIFAKLLKTDPYFVEEKLSKSQKKDQND